MASRPEASGTRITSSAALVDYARSLDCIHCGLCLQTCPTFRLTGVESSSPRGRIHLMRAVGEGRLEPDAAYVEELDFCLLCRHCESVCPAGVEFGQMMEFARGKTAARHGVLARLARWIGFRVLLPHRALLRLAGSALRLVQLLRLDRLVQGDVPRVRPGSARRLLPALTPALGEERERVVVLEGCVMPEFFPETNRATVSSLARLGVSSRIPRELVCCGSLHAHNGDTAGARQLARRMIEACEPLMGPGGGPIVVNSAGCGAHMKECAQLFEAGDPWRARAEAFADRVVDYTEFVAARLPEGLDPPAIEGPLTWDDPCHLCHGQGIRAEPRAILERLGVERVELPSSESCCGSAGIYSLLRPADSQAVFEPRREAFESS